jgi:hypothetical protein
MGKYMDENKFMNRVIELVDNSKTQRDGVGTTLVEEFNLAGKHTVTRLVNRMFDISISQMLKLKFEYPDTWKSKVPKIQPTNSVDMYTRIMELRNIAHTFQEAKAILMQEYNVSEMELVRRVRSLCQKSLAEIFEPTDSEIQNCLIRAETSEEFRELLGASSKFMSGFIERRLGVSTFKQAKASCLYKMKVQGISPCTADNEALIVSQVLGDGSYDKVRKVIRIQHGIKQLEYLRWKVSVLQNAYPNLNGVKNIKIRLHAQGHEYADWYSGKLPEHITNKLDTYTHKELVNLLTPLGMLWLFLDDGCLFWKETKSISISNGIDLEKHQNISDYISTYGIHSVAYDKSCVIAQQVEIVKFINTFVKPYINIIPVSMQYKTQLMI